MRFLLDAMCGKLAVYLRMCGHDAAYVLDEDTEEDERILAWARAEDRTLVTRDRQLASRAEDSILLTEREVADQLDELRQAGISLALADEPAFCGTCNGPVERVRPEEPTPDYAPDTGERAVWRCENCGQHFWKGSHWDRVKGVVEGEERDDSVVR